MKEDMSKRINKAMALRNIKAVDISNKTGIPKSSISQYRSGYSKNMDIERLSKIAEVLDVSEAWLMGYDVPMERDASQKEAEELADLIVYIRENKDFRDLVFELRKLNKNGIKSLLTFLQLQ